MKDTIYKVTNSKWLFISVYGVFITLASVVIPGILYIAGMEVNIKFLAIIFPVGIVMFGICGNEYYLETIVGKRSQNS